MLLKRLYETGLAQASYLIACPASHEALVVDPNRDVDRYLKAAHAEGMKIAYVTETHIHADYLSGARDLAKATGAKLLLSGHGGDDWSYRFASSSNARLLHHGDTFDVGCVRVGVRHTPGHTPEHICFVLTDTEASDKPLGMLTGDFIFVGDVGRPDLLERAANVAGTMEAMARSLYKSLVATRDLPDYLQLWPGHGAGSACGKALGAVPSTTLGYERIANWAFQAKGEEDFVQQVLAGQPEPPRYFAVMKTLNRDGPPPRDPARMPTRLTLPEVERALAAGRRVVDVRATREFAREHIPGTINLPVGKSFATWAGSLLPYDDDILLLADDDERIRGALELLMLIGIDRVTGWGGRDLRDAWRAAGRPLSSTHQMSVAEAAKRDDVQIVDVRRESEWTEGHIPEAEHLFLGDLEQLSEGLSRDTPIVLHCQGGSRSAIAASLLKAKGFSDVSNLEGGFDSWRKAGLPVEDEQG